MTKKAKRHAPAPKRKAKAAAKVKSKRPATVKKLPFHPYANAFPLIEGDEFKEFCARGKERGFIKTRPIVLFEKAILDGRNRYRMCLATGLKPVFRQFDPKTEGDPLEFVISENLDRRHLTASQRALAAASLEKLARGRPRKGATGVSRDEAADRMNVSRRSVARAAIVRDEGSVGLQKLVADGAVPIALAADIAHSLTPLEQEIVVNNGEAAILNAAKKIRAKKSEARREERNKRIVTTSDCSAESMLAGGRKYPLIFADPALRYIMGDTDRSVENHYGTMSLEEICALPVAELAATDCVLVLAMPETHLFASGLPIMTAWGFTHKSGAVWDKVKMGMGKYFRVQHEHLLICTRGAVPEPLPANKSRSIIRVPRSSEHSEKPKQFYEVIEKMYPQFIRKDGEPLAIELFARALKPKQKPRPGWAVWGNQAPQDAKKRTAEFVSFGNIGEGLLKVLGAIERGETIDFDENDHVVSGLYTGKQKRKLTKAGKNELARLRKQKLFDTLPFFPGGVEPPSSAEAA